MDQDPQNTGDKTNPRVGGGVGVGGGVAADGPTQRSSAAQNKESADSSGVRPSAIERQKAAMQSAAARRSDRGKPKPKRRVRGTSSDDGHSSDKGRGSRRLIFALVSAAGLILAVAGLRAPLMQTVSQAQSGALARITNTLQKTPAAIAAGGAEKAGAVTVPIYDVSVRLRPELLLQVVSVYRLQLETDPHNAEATATLARLREHTLAELDAMSLTENLALTAASLKLAATLFPELANDPRYQSLATRIAWNNSNQNQHRATDAPAVASEQTALSIAPAKIAAAEPTRPSLTSGSKLVETAEPLQPEIRVISLTPGVIEGERFVPAEGGNVFMLAINYRNLDKGSRNHAGGAELVTQLGSTNNPRLQAEVPMEIEGSGGKKNFLIGTFEHGHTGEAYTLNFILDGHALPPRTVRLTLAAYADSDL